MLFLYNNFKTWCPRGDLNSQNLVSKTSTYTNSVTRALYQQSSCFTVGIEPTRFLLKRNCEPFACVLFAVTTLNLVPNSGNDPLAYRLSSDCSTSELIGYYLKLMVDRGGVEPPTPTCKAGVFPSIPTAH